MSRLIVKNLPFSITDAKLRTTFAKHGAVTDLQLKYTYGKFGGFALILIMEFHRVSDRCRGWSCKKYLDGRKNLKPRRRKKSLMMI